MVWGDEDGGVGEDEGGDVGGEPVGVERGAGDLGVGFSWKVVRLPFFTTAWSTSFLYRFIRSPLIGATSWCVQSTI